MPETTILDATGKPYNFIESPTGIKVDTREISVSGSDVYNQYGIIDYNPDDLVGKKGLEIYQKMMLDDQVKAVINMKKTARLATSWRIIPGSDGIRDKEIRDFVKDNLDQIQGTFEQNLYQILSGLEYGYSVSELVWNRITKGKWAGYIGLKAIKTKEPFYYGFDSDEFGNLRPRGIVYTSSEPEDLDIDLGAKTPGLYGHRKPIKKFVVYSYNKQFSHNWYGSSDLRAAYRSWWSKEILIRFYNIYLERFGMPTHIGTLPKGTSKDDRDRLQAVLDGVQAKYSIVVPEDVKIDLLRAAGGGDFPIAIEMHNKFIARSILIPDLLGYTSGGAGSYALGRKHFDVFVWILHKLGRDIEETIVGEQIIKRLVNLNFKNIDKYPKFKFEDITEENTEAKARIINAGILGGFIDSQENWIRPYLTLPDKDEKEIELIKQKKREEAFATQLAAAQAADEKSPGNIRPTEAGISNLRSSSFVPSGVGNTALASKQQRIESPGSMAMSPRMYTRLVEDGIDRELTTFESKINYRKQLRNLNNYENDTVDNLSEIIKKQRDALIKTVENKKIIEDKNTTAVNKLQLKYVGDFKTELENKLIKLYLDSKLETAKELEQSNLNVDVVSKFAEIRLETWEPVAPREAIEIFNNKVIVKVIKEDGKIKVIPLAKNKDLSYYSAKAFTIAGIERDNVLKNAKAIILEGIKTGDKKEAIFQLRQLFDNYIARGILTDKKLISANRLETIVRTNMNEALNAGRIAMMRDPDVQDFVPYVMYSAILDDRVRASHAAMDSRIYRADDPIWDEISPPAGFNCRCVPPGTKIKTDKGSVSIEKIQLNDLVLTHKNQFKKVIELHKNECKEKLIELELCQNEIKLLLTPNHEVLTKNRGWIPAGELTLEDDIIIIQRKKHPEDCNCFCCKSARGEYKGKNHPSYGRQHPPDCGCAICKAKRGEYRGKNNPQYGKHPEGCTCCTCEAKLGGNKGKNNPMYGKTCPAAKRHLFDVPGQGKVWLRSTWELIYAKYLVAKRTRFKYECKRFYLDAKTYLPDFYLVDENKFKEVKGWMKDSDLKKMEEMKRFYPDIVVELVEGDEIRKIEKELVYEDKVN